MWTGIPRSCVQGLLRGPSTELLHPAGEHSLALESSAQDQVGRDHGAGIMFAMSAKGRQRFDLGLLLNWALWSHGARNLTPPRYRPGLLAVSLRFSRCFFFFLFFELSRRDFSSLWDPKAAQGRGTWSRSHVVRGGSDLKLSLTRRGEGGGPPGVSEDGVQARCRDEGQGQNRRGGFGVGFLEREA